MSHQPRQSSTLIVLQSFGIAALLIVVIIGLARIWNHRAPRDAPSKLTLAAGNTSNTETNQPDANHTLSSPEVAGQSQSTVSAAQSLNCRDGKDLTSSAGGASQQPPSQSEQTNEPEDVIVPVESENLAPAAGSEIPPSDGLGKPEHSQSAHGGLEEPSTPLAHPEPMVFIPAEPSGPVAAPVPANDSIPDSAPSVGGPVNAAPSPFVPQVEPADPAPFVREPISAAPSQLVPQVAPQVGPRLANIPAPIELHRRKPTIGPADKLTEEMDRRPSVAPAVPAIPRREATLAQNPVRCWEEPKALLDALDELSKTRYCAGWAKEVVHWLRQLGMAISSNGAGSPQASAAIGRLDQLVDACNELAAQTNDPTIARRLRQAGHALRRRLDVWRALPAFAQPLPLEAEIAQKEKEQLALCLREVDALMASGPEGRAWREFLLLDALHQATQPSASLAESRMLAEEVLYRLSYSAMSARQRAFVSRAPVGTLEAHLRRIALRPVAPSDLLVHLERYEQSRLPSHARHLATDVLWLINSPLPEHQQLGQRLETHYRNANLRISVSAELLNRLLPKQPVQCAPVCDTILGLPVYGQSLTTTHVGVRMIPDPSRIRMALEVTGEVASSTASSSGPATFYNNSTAYYFARKPIEVDLSGVRLEPVEVQVSTHMRLADVETDFDGVPLLGSLVKGIARSQHEQKRPAAAREIKLKVAHKARETIEREATARLREAADRVNQRAIAPLHSLALEPQIISAETTQQRFAVRLRMAGKEQLGSHTPRPQAPDDSLASVQIHESAINNALQQLNLDGKTFSLPQLIEHVAAKLDYLAPWEPNTDHDDVRITFAPEDAVRVQCHNGQMVLTLGIARLSKPPRYWDNFQVQAVYVPEVNGCSAELTRHGIIQLAGQRLNLGAQIALRGIFSRVFSKKTPWSITPERLATAPELADLEVTQFTIDDGWIGVAIGPKRTAARQPLLRR